jgi:hypothetical protein
MERFQWLTTEEAQAAVEDPAERAAVANELADIVIYCLSLPVLHQSVRTGTGRSGQGAKPRTWTSLRRC